MNYYRRVRAVGRVGTAPVNDCPIEGCGDPATEFLNYEKEVIVLCEDHADKARNDTLA